jgi:divalent metal cation (Fe/Co/Zn/Cd) transporter
MLASSTTNHFDYIGLWIVFITAVVNLFFPRFAWWCAEGWKFKNVKPSRLWLFLNGFFSVLVAIGVLLIIFVLEKPQPEEEPPKKPKPRSEGRRPR